MEILALRKCDEYIHRLRHCESVKYIYDTPACFNNPFVQYIYIILIYSGLESYVAKTTRTILFIWGKQLPVRQGYLHKWDVYGIKRIGMINILYNKDICNMQYCTGI